MFRDAGWFLLMLVVKLVAIMIERLEHLIDKGVDVLRRDE